MWYSGYLVMFYYLHRLTLCCDKLIFKLHGNMTSILYISILKYLALVLWYSTTECKKVSTPGLLDILKIARSNSAPIDHLTQVPSLLSTLDGYDPVYGDPSAFPNPGFRSQIFNPFTVDGNGKPIISPFISQAHSDYNCKQEFTSTSSKNYNEYKEQKTSSVSFSEGAEASAGGGFGPFSFKASAGKAREESKEEQNTQKFFQETQGSISTSTTQCITHKVRLSSFVAPNFTEGFQRGLIELQRAAELNVRRNSNTQTAKRILRQFLYDFGTHYLKSTYLGSKLIFEKRFLSQTSNTESESSRNKCVSDAAHGSVGGGVGGFFSAEASFSKNLAACAGGSESSKAGSQSSYETENVVSIGSLLTSNDNALFEDIIKSVPIQFELDKITSLLRSEWLRPIKYRNRPLNPELIYKFLEEGFHSYCTLVLGKQEHGDCNVREGCGYSSDCKANEICIDDKNSEGGYFCDRKYGE